MAKIQVYGPPSEVHYHRLPTQLERIATQPQKEHVIEALQQISYAALPELVADLLRIEGHMNVAVVDGSGDEGRDVHSVLPDGTRQLTQCKHHDDPKSKISVDDLDKVVMAGLRKGYQNLLIVTNTDLTAPAHKYVLDQDYSKSPPLAAISVIAWTAQSLWDRLGKRAELLNKWLSGIAQVHALQNFRVMLLPLRMPDESPLLGNADFGAMHAHVEKHMPGDVDAPLTLSLKHGAQVTVEEYVASIADFRSPTASDLESGLYAHHVLECRFSTQQQPLVPTALITEALECLAPWLRTLASLSDTSWISVLASRPMATAFVHSTSSATELVLGDHSAFVITHEAVEREDEYVLAATAGWKREIDDDDTSVFRLGETEVHANLNMEVAMSAMEYDFQHAQLAHIVKDFNAFLFINVPSPTDKNALHDVRASVGEHAFVLDRGNEQIVIGLIDEKKTHLVAIQAKLHALGLVSHELLGAERDDLQKMLERQLSQQTRQVSIGKMLGDWTSPARLTKRNYWVFSSLPVQGKLDEVVTFTKLVEFKQNFLAGNGGTAPLEGLVPEFKASRFLTDPLTIYGPRDINLRYNIAEDKILVLYKKQVTDCRRGDALTAELTSEFASFVDLLRKHVEGELTGNWTVTMTPHRPRSRRN